MDTNIQIKRWKVHKVTAHALMFLMFWLSGAACAGTVTYVYTDAQGTPLAEADTDGNITARFDYTPYGVSVPSVGPTPDGPGYTGHVNDPDTGLVYMQARYYDPAVGRFLSVDPVGPRPGNTFNFNRYNYANNSPYKFTDPNGRAVDTIVDAGFIVYDTGRFLGASAAAVVGAATGNDALQSAGLVGMREAGADLGASAASAAVPGLIAPMARGALAEARVLKDIGEVKNTQKVVTSQGNSIPDFLNAKQVGEIKDTKRVTNTKQLRSQREYAQATGREHVVITGTDTKLSKAVEQESTVARRDDLGPQRPEK